MTDRFSPVVQAALLAAGWQPGRRLPAQTVAEMHLEVRERVGVFGGRLRPHTAATQALTEFGGLTVGTAQDGTDLHPRPFALDPGLAADSVETMIDVGRALGTDVYPLGIEGLHDAVLAITTLGAVLAIDPVGEWLLGETMDEALETLITGRRPSPALPTAGPWPGRRGPAPAVDEPDELKTLGGLKRPVGAAFFLPRSPANLDYVWLPDTLTRLGMVARADDISPGRLVVEWGGLFCEAYALDLADFTVLVLAFEQNAMLAQRAEDPVGAAEGLVGESPPDATALARAFRDACAALPELDVAFVQTHRRYDLLRFVADQSFAVLTVDVPTLLGEGLPLLYLSEGFALDADTLVNRSRHDELPITDGRLIFASTGRDRW
jgi:hypothetical protein